MKITVEVDGDEHGLIDALMRGDIAVHAFARDTKRTLDDAGDRTGRSFGQRFRHGFDEAMIGAAKGITATLGMAGKGIFNPVTMIGGLIFGAAQAIAAVAPVVGVLNLIPAAALGAATSLGTLLIAIHGVGKAIAAGLTGDMQQYQKALAKLVPSQRELVKEVVALKPALTAIKENVASTFFYQLGKDIHTLGGMYLPLMNSELGATAAVFNNMIQSYFNWLKVPDTFRSISTSLNNVTEGFRRASEAFLPFISGLNDLVAVGSTFLPGLGQGVANLGDRFSEFMARIAGDNTLHDWIQNSLDVLKMFGGLLKDAWNVLMPIIHALNATSGGGFGFLGKLLRDLGDFFKSTEGTRFLTNLFTILNKIFTGLANAVMMLLPIIGKLLDALMPLFNPENMAVFGQAISDIGQALDQLVTALLPVLPLLLDMTVHLLPVLIPLLRMFVDLIIAQMPFLYAMARVLDQIAPALDGIANALANAADWLDKILPPFLTFENTVSDSLVKVHTWRGVGSWFSREWEHIVNAVKVAIQWFRDLPKHVQRAMDNFMTTVGFFIGTVVKEFFAFPGQLWKILTITWDRAYAIFHEATKRIERAIVTFLKQSLDHFLHLPENIKKAFHDAGEWLYDTGRNITIGLIKGAESMFDTSVKKIVKFAKDIWHGFSRAIGIGSESKVFMYGGQMIVAGLVKGIVDNAKSARTAVAGLLGTIGTGGGLAVPGLAVGMALAGATGGGRAQVIHVHNHVYLDSKQLHAGLIQPAQRYKARTGTTGLT
jgi:phage-related protein